MSPVQTETPEERIERLRLQAALERAQLGLHFQSLGARTSGVRASAGSVLGLVESWLRLSRGSGLAGGLIKWGAVPTVLRLAAGLWRSRWGKLAVLGSVAGGVAWWWNQSGRDEPPVP